MAITRMLHNDMRPTPIEEEKICRLKTPAFKLLVAKPKRMLPMKFGMAYRQPRRPTILISTFASSCDFINTFKAYRPGTKSHRRQFHKTEPTRNPQPKLTGAIGIGSNNVSSRAVVITQNLIAQ